MPSSHLPRTLIWYSQYAPRTPCDKFVYDFPCDFLGIVGGYTGYGIILCAHIVYGHRAISSTGPQGQPGVNPYRDCAEIVRKSCRCRPVSAAPHGNRTEPVRGSAFARCPCGDCNATYDMSMGYGLTIFSKFVKLLAKPNRRGRGAREYVRKSHGRLLPPQGGLAEAARKGGYGQDTGSVDPSQAKCELGIRAGYGLRRPIASQMWTRHNSYTTPKLISGGFRTLQEWLWWKYKYKYPLRKQRTLKNYIIVCYFQTERFWVLQISQYSSTVRSHLKKIIHEDLQECLQRCHNLYYLESFERGQNNILYLSYRIIITLWFSRLHFLLFYMESFVAKCNKCNSWQFYRKAILSK